LCQSYNQQKQRDIYRTDKSVNSENSVSYFFLLFLCTLKFDLKKKKEETKSDNSPRKIIVANPLPRLQFHGYYRIALSKM